MQIAIDIESTGFNPHKNDIIQLAAVEILDDLTIGRTFETKLRPVRPQYWTEGAEKIHKITKFEAMRFPERREGIMEFMKWLLPLKPMFQLGFVYHGKNNFDYNFVKAAFVGEILHDSFFKAFSDEMVYSTCDLSAEWLKLENNKLNTVCKALKIDLNHHEALSDAIACAKIWCALKGREAAYKADLFNPPSF